MSSALVACLALVVPRAAAHGAWRAVEPMPVALSDFTATSATSADGDDVVVVVGGCDDHQVSCDWWDGCSYCPSVAATARAFDVAADAWVDLAAPPRPRYRHAAAYDAENNLVYVVGGRDSAKHDAEWLRTRARAVLGDDQTRVVVEDASEDVEIVLLAGPKAKDVLLGGHERKLQCDFQLRLSDRWSQKNASSCRDLDERW